MQLPSVRVPNCARSPWYILSSWYSGYAHRLIDFRTVTKAVRLV